MTTQTQTDRATPCPTCGYDLRGTPTLEGQRRCPECGNIFHGHVSQIPWLHRRRHGRIKTFLRTTLMVLRHPHTFAAEIRSRTPRRDALKFHRIALTLGTILATSLIAAASIINEPPLPELNQKTFGGLPIYICANSKWGIAPLLLGIYLAAWMTMAIYRTTLSLGSPHGFARRRLQRTTLYSSAAGMLWMSLLALLFFGIWIMQLDRPWVEEWRTWITLGCYAIGALAMATYLVPTVALVWRTGRRKILRALLLTLIFPPLSAATTLAIICAVFWITGYIVLAVYSMTR